MDSFPPEPPFFDITPPFPDLDHRRIRVIEDDGHALTGTLLEQSKDSGQLWGYVIEIPQEHESVDGWRGTYRPLFSKEEIYSIQSTPERGEPFLIRLFN